MVHQSPSLGRYELSVKGDMCWCVNEIYWVWYIKTMSRDKECDSRSKFKGSTT